MANEFKHKDPGGELTQAEFVAACGDGHIFACQATGDIVYASSATVLSKLAKGAANTVLSMGGSCIPAWTASPSVTDLTIGGGCITLTGAATDVDLIDNNACAISFDAAGQAGILAIDTQNCAEGVKMSGKLTVTGAISSTGALTVGVDDTGHDVKFFGAAAGAFMIYDQSCDQLEIRGASADATTSTGKLLLSTSLTNVNANDVIGSINFQAPAEAGGTDAIAIAAGIRAVAQATFTCAVNATDLIFYTGHSEAATEKFRFTSQNEIGIAGANYGTDGQVLTSGGAGAAAAWEDAAGGGLDSCADAIIHNGYGIVIGHTGVLASADHPANTVGEFTMIGAAGGDTGVHILRHSADAGGGAIRFAKSRNATVASHTIVQACDTLGEISFFGCDGGDFQPFAARIRVHVDGTPGTGDMPGRIEFSTTADGAESPTLAMKIDKTQCVTVSAGNVGIGTAGKGIDFSAQTQSTAYTAASEVLDHYEEGNWTPVVKFGGGTTGIVYSNSGAHQNGEYTRIGDMVFLQGYIALTDKGSSTGNFTITGIPFTTNNENDYAVVSMQGRQMTYDGHQSGIITTNQIGFGEIAESGSYSTLTNSNFACNTEISVTVAYQVAT